MSTEAGSSLSLERECRSRYYEPLRTIGVGTGIGQPRRRITAAVAPDMSSGRESHQDCRTAMKDAVTPAGPPSCGLARRTDPTSD